MSPLCVSDLGAFALPSVYTPAHTTLPLQDYFIDTTIAFYEATGAGGVGYDYTFLEAPNVSLYSQWSGWRYVLTTLRTTLGTAERGYVVDNRQLNHMWVVAAATAVVCP